MRNVEFVFSDKINRCANNFLRLTATLERDQIDAVILLFLSACLVAFYGLNVPCEHIGVVCFSPI